MITRDLNAAQPAGRVRRPSEMPPCRSDPALGGRIGALHQPPQVPRTHTKRAPWVSRQVHSDRLARLLAATLHAPQHAGPADRTALCPDCRSAAQGAARRCRRRSQPAPAAPLHPPAARPRCCRHLVWLYWPPRLWWQQPAAGLLGCMVVMLSAPAVPAVYRTRRRSDSFLCPLAAAAGGFRQGCW